MKRMNYYKGSTFFDFTLEPNNSKYYQVEINVHYVLYLVHYVLPNTNSF